MKRLEKILAKENILPTLAVLGVMALVCLVGKDYLERRAIEKRGATIALASGTRQRHYVGPIGEKSLKLKKGEPLDIGYWVGDEDGLKEVTFYVNGEIVDQKTNLDLYSQSGVMTRDVNLAPGKYEVKILAIDETDQKIEDTAKLTILNEEYKN